MYHQRLTSRIQRMCLHPYIKRIKTPEGRYKNVVFPCGHCIDCLKDYQNSWKIRLSEEFAETCKGVFFTLTYSPATAPLSFDENGEVVETDEYLEYMETEDKRVLSLRYSDIQQWLNRCRMAYNRYYGLDESDFKYFICGEYGPRTLRPHYHGVILGMDENDFREFFATDWQLHFGFVDVSTLELSDTKSPQRVANYVSKYCAKGDFFENPRVSAGYVEKPRRGCSKGIGLAYAKRLKNTLMPGFSHIAIPRDPAMLHNTIHSDCAMSIVDRYHNPWHIVSFYPPKIKQKPTAENLWRTSRFPALHYSPEINSKFLERLSNQLVSVYYDPQQNKTFIYKLPRYVRNKVLGEKTALAQQLQDYVQVRNSQLRSQEFAELSAQHPDWSEVQVNNYMVRLDFHKRCQRARTSRETLNKFYGQSKF